MNTKEERRKVQNVYTDELLMPGEMVLLAPNGQAVTVASYGVVVCLWDKNKSGAFMCHFLEPIIRIADLATPRFGNVALLKGIEWMLSLCSVQSIEAQIFGGAQGDNRDKRGEDNLFLAREILQNKGIQIVSEDVGGQKGRKILLDAATGTVAVMKVHSLRQGDWL